jgi:hypothetical protein
MLSTTAAVLEILIIGIQSVLWLGLAFAAMLGLNMFERAAGLPDALVIAVVGLVAYAMGVIVDRIADNIRFSNHLRPTIYRPSR